MIDDNSVLHQIWRASKHQTTQRGMLRGNYVKEIIPEYDFAVTLLNTEGYCPVCGTQVGIFKLEVDHKLPISKAPCGFVYTIEDIQFICRKCNRLKQDKIPEQYLDIAVDTGVVGVQIEVSDKIDIAIRRYMLDNNIRNKRKATVAILEAFFAIKPKKVAIKT